VDAGARRRAGRNGAVGKDVIRGTERIIVGSSEFPTIIKG
jgi:hypothetical protein